MTNQTPSGYRQITVNGGDLFQIAAQQLGDATQWNLIAQINGLFDNKIIGPMVLNLPPVNPSAGNGGILGQ